MKWPGRISGLLGLCVATVALGATVAQAAGPPQIAATWVTDVNATSANLRAELNPNEFQTFYRFEYTAEEAFNAKGFAGASKAPAGTEAQIGAGESPVAVVQHVGGLKPTTSYRFRIAANNSAGPVSGPARVFGTEENAPVFSLPDNRGWEMVSPVNKNGGQVDPPETNLGGGVLQAAADGHAATFSSSASFGEAKGAAPGSQYLSARTTSGWLTENVTTPLLSGGYPDSADAGVPYQLFSVDLAKGLLSNGRRCRSSAETRCLVPSPPLAGSGAPAGYREYYLRDGGGSFKALLTAAELGGQDPEDFEVSFAGATPDLGQVALSSCFALTSDATEVPGLGGCDPDKANLYLYSGSGLELINLLPGDTQGTPGASLAAQNRAISIDGSRVYWTEEGDLYLREGSQSFQIDESLGGGGTFESATPDGSIAFLSKAGHLYRYTASSKTLTDLTPGGEVQGVLGASDDGSYLYYATASGLLLDHEGAITPIASGAETSSYPPATGTARVGADGAHLAFISKAPLSDYDNNGVSEVYLYDAAKAALTCASCNPTGERPLGPSSIPGAIANGAATRAYKPRVLSTSGSRLFFDSFDSLVPQDTNSDRDVYQWEARGTGSCGKPGGCVSLISSGRASEGASFVDASADGSDAFFLTDGSLITSDPGSVDLYDARVGGSFAEPPTVIPCVGDACQALPPEPEDPGPGTAFSSAFGNPKVSFPRVKGKGHRKGGGKNHRHGNRKGHHVKNRGGR